MVSRIAPSSVTQANHSWFRWVSIITAKIKSGHRRHCVSPFRNFLKHLHTIINDHRYKRHQNLSSCIQSCIQHIRRNAKKGFPLKAERTASALPSPAVQAPADTGTAASAQDHKDHTTDFLIFGITRSAHVVAFFSTVLHAPEIVMKCRKESSIIAIPSDRITLVTP